MLRRYKHVLLKLYENVESYIPLTMLPDGHGRDGHKQNATNATMRELQNLGYVVFNSPDMYLITSKGVAAIKEEKAKAKMIRGVLVEPAGESDEA